jgi:predicted ABC-type ATPase
VETVLSSPKYRDLILKAQSRRFRVKMIYVLLRSAELQIERVRLRVSEGGHDVPVDKIVDRRWRSFVELAWFIRHVDECYIFDNSTGEPEMLAALAGGALLRMGNLPADLEAALDESDPIDLRDR